MCNVLCVQLCVCKPFVIHNGVNVLNSVCKYWFHIHTDLRTQPVYIISSCFVMHTIIISRQHKYLRIYTTHLCRPSFGPKYSNGGIIFMPGCRYEWDVTMNWSTTNGNYNQQFNTNLFLVNLYVNSRLKMKKKFVFDIL